MGSWARKNVDDTLIWAATEPELLERARIILQRCKENNITISQKKLELSNKIKFAGHISDEGYGPDNEKFAAIAKFPNPKNLRDLRGFIGLANQLGMFIPDLAHMTHMDGSLQPSYKNRPINRSNLQSVRRRK